MSTIHTYILPHHMCVFRLHLVYLDWLNNAFHAHFGIEVYFVFFCAFQVQIDVRTWSFELDLMWSWGWSIWMHVSGRELHRKWKRHAYEAKITTKTHLNPSKRSSTGAHRYSTVEPLTVLSSVKKRDVKKCSSGEHGRVVFSNSTVLLSGCYFTTRFSRDFASFLSPFRPLSYIYP